MPWINHENAIQLQDVQKAYRYVMNDSADDAHRVKRVCASSEFGHYIDDLRRLRNNATKIRMVDSPI